MDTQDKSESEQIDPFFEEKWSAASRGLSGQHLSHQHISEVKKRMQAFWLLQNKVMQSEPIKNGDLTYDVGGSLHDEHDDEKHITRMTMTDTFFKLFSDPTQRNTLRAYLNLYSLSGGEPDGERLIKFMDRELGWTVGVAHGHQLADDMTLRMVAKLTGSSYVRDEVDKYIMTTPIIERELSLSEQIQATLFERALRDENPKVRQAALMGLIDITKDQLQEVDTGESIELVGEELDLRMDNLQLEEKEETDEDESCSSNEVELCELLGGLAETLYNKERFSELTEQEKEDARKKFETLLKQEMIAGQYTPLVGAFIEGPLSQYAGKEYAGQFAQRFSGFKGSSEKYDFSTDQIFRNIDVFV